MNISDVVNDIKFSQGLNAIALPYNEPVENVIQNILKMTVREFSDFEPYIREVPSSLTTTHVKSASAEAASSQYQSEEATTNAFTVGTPFVGFGSYYPQDILAATSTGAAINKFAGVTSQLPTSKYLGYNKIQLFNFPAKCYIKFRVACEHDPSLETIPDSFYTSFVELATLDVQRTLYNNIKNRHCITISRICKMLVLHSKRSNLRLMIGPVLKRLKGNCLKTGQIDSILIISILFNSSK